MNVPIYEIYSGGTFINTPTQWIIKSPYDQRIVGQTYLAGPEILQQAVQAAQRVSAELSVLPSHCKYKALMQISEEMYALRYQFAELIVNEAGKPLKYALAEVDRSIQTFKIAAEESKRIQAEYMSLDWTLAGEGKEGLMKYFPAGIVAGISPFNYPLNLAVHKIAPAIAAGCPIILKPSSSTPLSTLFLARLIAHTSLPAGAVSILPMDRSTGNIMVSHPEIAVLSFTGSPEVGWKMKKEAEKKKVILELGGNAGVIVASNKNMEQTVKKCVSGSFAFSGQVCIHTQRIYVLQAIFFDFIDSFVKETKKLKVGNPMDTETDISGMIDLPNAIRVENWIEQAVHNGATILSGGKRKDNFVEPTILTGTKENMHVCADEVFGPVVVVEPVSSFEEAVSRINSGRFGLQAGVFTDSISQMNYAFNTLKVGGVILNDIPTFRVDHMPYGGVKDSGSGREGVKYAMLDMMEPRLLVKNSI